MKITPELLEQLGFERTTGDWGQDLWRYSYDGLDVIYTKPAGVYDGYTEPKPAGTWTHPVNGSDITTAQELLSGMLEVARGFGYKACQKSMLRCLGVDK